MVSTAFIAGDSPGTTVPRWQYNYVQRETKELLGSNRARLSRKTDNATSIQEREDFYEQVRDYLLGSLDPEWSEHASELEEMVLNQLYGEGHEKVAERLSLLIGFLADDGERFSIESVFAFARFVLTTRPQYPGPGIFGDDDGHVGIQWRVPPIKSSDEDDPYSGGILYLEFIAPERVSYFYDVEDDDSEAYEVEEDDVGEGEASLDEIMEAIKPITRRLDW